MKSEKEIKIEIFNKVVELCDWVVNLVEIGKIFIWLLLYRKVGYYAKN